MAFSMFTKLYSHRHSLIPEQFSHPQRRSVLTSSSLQPLTTTHLLSVFMDLPLLGISHKREQTLRGHLCLASFAQHHVFKVHPRYRKYQYFIPFYG